MPRKGFRRAAAIAAVVVAAALAADCYERTLTSYRIRQAYFLGKSATAKRAEFLRQYFRSFPLPKRGPHVARSARGGPPAADQRNHPIDRDIGQQFEEYLF